MSQISIFVGGFLIMLVACSGGISYVIAKNKEEAEETANFANWGN